MVDEPQVVNPDQPTPDPVSPDVKGQDPEPVSPGGEPGKPDPKPGEKTSRYELLKATRRARRKNRILAEENEELREKLKTNNPPDPPEGDTDEPVEDGRIEKVESEVSGLKKDLALEKVMGANPILKEHTNDFKEFVADPDNKGMKLETAAKAFIIENGLDTTPRKGLEKGRGGKRAPVSPGMTAEEVKDLRINDPKKYYKMLKRGQIKYKSDRS